MSWRERLGISTSTDTSAEKNSYNPQNLVEPDGFTDTTDTTLQDSVNCPQWTKPDPDPLPECHYRAEDVGGIEKDTGWIKSQLRRLPLSQRATVAQEYSEIYKAEYEREPLSHCKDGAARFKANTWLRTLSEKD